MNVELRSIAIDRLVEAGIQPNVATLAVDITLEVFADNPELPKETRFLEYRSIRIDTQLRKFWYKGVEIFPTKKEGRLLEYFLRNPGKIVGTRKILLDVWGKGYVDSVELLRVHICGIRTKTSQDIIRNKTGEGYWMPADE